MTIGYDSMWNEICFFKSFHNMTGQHDPASHIHVSIPDFGIVVQQFLDIYEC